MPRELEEATDYVLPDALNSVWITVDNISVYIHRESQGVAVDLYPLNDENSDLLSGCYITFAEAETKPSLN